jgi:Archaea-specific editing domain of threonyl-tRNA synthetase
MKLLCFQAKRFRWQAHSKTLPDVADQEIDREVEEAVIAFIHAEAGDAAAARSPAVLRQSVKHIKWLANKRSMKNIVLHSFAHLGGAGAEPGFAASFIEDLAGRLRESDYKVWTTPFGYFCEWDLRVYGDSLAKVWKEIH